MDGNELYQRLSLLCSRSSCLPQLPGSALRLLRLLDDPDAPTATIEKVVLSDPSLTAAILRVANSAAYGGRVQTTTIAGALLRIGARSMRLLALSLATHALIATSPRQTKLDPFRMARHSMFVGFAASAAFGMRQISDDKVKPDEVLAAGILHDIHFTLLNRIAPKILDRSIEHAAFTSTPLADALDKVLAAPGRDLVGASLRAWTFPNELIDAISGVDRPERAHPYFHAHACLHAADYMASRYGYGVEDWPVQTLIHPAVEEFLGEDIPALVQLVPTLLKDVEAYLQEHALSAA